jgi:hypothetical protein
MTRRFIPFAVVLMLMGTIIGCSTQPTPTVTAVTITGTAPAIGASAQFTAVATMSDGTTRNVTTDPTVSPVPSWVSTNVNVATVSSTGVVTGVSAGSATIQVTYLSYTGTLAIQIGG